MTLRCTTLNTTSTEFAAANNTQIAIKTLINDIRDKLVGTYILGNPGLAIGSTNTAVANRAFTYMIAGVQYSKAAVAAGTAPGNDIVPTGKYGAVAFDIGADGTIDAIKAPANATGYTTAALAAAALPAVAANHVRMGYVTATKSDGNFTFGTTALNAANSTVVYTTSQTGFAQIGAAVA